MFGGRVASGWHTACICMRLYVDAVLHDAASLSSPGMSTVSWPAPVRARHTLTATLTVLACRPSSRNADRGSALVEWQGTNRDGVVVLVMRGR